MSAAIDWGRMAAPQADGYDTEVTLRFATTSSSPLRPEPYRRRPVDGAPALFGGRVAVRNRPSGGLTPPRYAPASPTHPNLAAAEKLLEAWPDIAVQFPQLIDTIQPWTDTTMTPEYWLSVPGSSSHSLEDEFGIIMATVDSPIGLAQALVHEMAHHKLRALGVSLLQASRLVTNNPEDLFVSPIIVNRRRPMTAVLHAQYSFIHVTALDVALYDAPDAPEDQKRHAIYLLARNVPRMEAGFEEIEAHVETDAEGAAFVAAFMSWSLAVLTRGREIMDANGYGIPAL